MGIPSLIDVIGACTRTSLTVIMRKSFANLFSDVQDPALKRLAVVVPGYIFKSRSDSTVR